MWYYPSIEEYKKDLRDRQDAYLEVMAQFDDDYVDDYTETYDGFREVEVDD